MRIRDDIDPQSVKRTPEPVVVGEREEGDEKAPDNAAPPSNGAAISSNNSRTDVAEVEVMEGGA